MRRGPLRGHWPSTQCESEAHTANFRLVWVGMTWLFSGGKSSVDGPLELDYDWVTAMEISRWGRRQILDLTMFQTRLVNVREELICLQMPEVMLVKTFFASGSGVTVKSIGFCRYVVWSACGVNVQVLYNSLTTVGRLGGCRRAFQVYRRHYWDCFDFNCKEGNVLLLLVLLGAIEPPWLFLNRSLTHASLHISLVLQRLKLQ